MTEEYVNQILLKLDVDESSFQNARKKSEGMFADIDASLQKKLKDTAALEQSITEKIAKLKSELKSVESLRGKGNLTDAEIDAATKELQAKIKAMQTTFGLKDEVEKKRPGDGGRQLKESANTASNYFLKGLESITGKLDTPIMKMVKSIDYTKSVSDNLFNVVKSGMDSIISLVGSAANEIRKMATYDYANSYRLNTSSLSTSMRYGLSGGETYAYEKAIKAVGANSMEELAMYGNENQFNYFKDRLDYYTKWYEEAEDSGMFKTFQEFDIFLEEYKTELMMDMVKWMVDNKDTIKNALNLLVDIAKGVLTVLGSIFEFFNGSTRQSNANEIISNATYNTTNTTNNNVEVQSYGWLTNLSTSLSYN